MHIHYFQRYSAPENIMAHNSLLLLSSLYDYSPRLYQEFMSRLMENDFMGYDGSILTNFEQPDRDESPMLGAQVWQYGFRIVIEAKTNNDIDEKQLQSYLASFDVKNEKYQILMTLTPDEISKEHSEKIRKVIQEKNTKSGTNIKCIPMTFKDLISAVESVLDKEHDAKFTELIDDYRDCCWVRECLPRKDKLMRAVPTGTTFEDNMKFSLYYAPVDRGFSKHAYLALYKSKAIRAVGKLVKVVKADVDIDAGKVIADADAQLTEDQKQNILEAVKAARAYNYNITSGHNFFLVERFYPTHFLKTSSGGLLGAKFFDIEQYAPGKTIQGAEDLADKLRGQTW